MKNYFEILFLEEAFEFLTGLERIYSKNQKRNENIHLRSSSRQAYW